MSDLSTEARTAHAEARHRYGIGAEAVMRRVAFEAGAQWAASRPVTDAEVDAAVDVAWRHEQWQYREDEHAYCECYERLPISDRPHVELERHRVRVTLEAARTAREDKP